MPTPYIEKLNKQGKGSIQELESKWSEAKKLAADQGHTEEYDYITGIFNKMVGASVTTALRENPGKIMIRSQAISRLQETAAPSAERTRLSKRIADINKQLQALTGKTDNASKTKRAKLQEDLKVSRAQKKKLSAKAEVETAVTDIKGAAEVIRDIFQDNGIEVTCSPKKGDNPRIAVKGYTYLGKLNFDLYLSDNKKDLLIDWWDSSGIYSIEEKVVKELKKLKFGNGASTKQNDLNKFTRDAMRIDEVSDELETVFNDAKDAIYNFTDALEEIRNVMQKNPVPKV